MACAGNPAAYFTRLKRSSSTAAISRPSQTIAADAFAWYALIPRIFIARLVSVPQENKSRGEMPPAPLIEYIERPGPRPGGLARQKCSPYGTDAPFMQMRRERRSRIREARFQPCAQTSAQPFFPGQSKGPLALL